jgi:thymidylate synthase (FAD)
MILPMATSTVMYLNGSVRSWIHYLAQRTDQHAQLEHREVAEEIKRIFAEQFPNVAKAIEDGKSS